MKIPSAGTPISICDLLRGVLGSGGTADLKGDLRALLDVPWCGLANSGTAVLYAILQALRKRSNRREVLLPAYTAPSLILPIRRAGLRPVLCEVSLDTFNAGSAEMLGRVHADTLAVMPVHMFGLPTDMPEIAQQLDGSGAFSIEDACSAMGARIGNRPAGTLGDLGFYSFNRGKNLSTLSGGAVVTHREDLASDLESALAAFPQPAFPAKLGIAVRTAALALVVHPPGYTLLYPAVSRFKYTELHTDFEAHAYTPFQSRIGRCLLLRLGRITGRRMENGRFLRRSLSGVKGVRLPRVPDGCAPAYNQFPILLQDGRTRASVHRAILKTGLEATRLYPEPIHRIYPDLGDGTGPDPFPNATALSRRLLLIPVHPLVPGSALVRAVEAIRKELHA